MSGDNGRQAMISYLNREIANQERDLAAQRRAVRDAEREARPNQEIAARRRVAERTLERISKLKKSLKKLTD